MAWGGPTPNVKHIKGPLPATVHQLPGSPKNFSPAAGAAVMEPPECPVCLQFYDGAATIPRVLPCGHSTCESCLGQLHHPHPHTIRCPACTQLVKFPHHGGAAALPKNVDLLRLSLILLDPNSDPSNSKQSQSNQDFGGQRVFVPQVWSHELYSAWKDWVLSEDAVVLINGVGDRQVTGVCSTLEGKLKISSKSVDFGSVSPLWCRLKDEKKVGLVKVGECKLDEGVFESTYVGRVMGVLSGMRETERTELRLVLDVSLRIREVCDVYGLWFDSERRSLYMVCERKDVRLLESIDGGREGVMREAIEKDRVSYLMMICLELCEALMALQLEGLCYGCLGLSCFAIDEFGHVLVDLSEALMSGRKIQKWVSDAVNHSQKSGDNGAEVLVAGLRELDVFASPELLFKMFGDGVVQVKDAELESMDKQSDVWLLACILVMLLVGKPLLDEMFNYLLFSFHPSSDEAVSEAKVQYMAWVDELATNLEASLGSDFMLLHCILCRCLDFEPIHRPLMADVRKSIKSLISKSCDNMVVKSREISSLYCLALGALCCFSDERKPKPMINEIREGCDDDRETLHQTWEDGTQDIGKDLPLGKAKCSELEGHLDRVTGFCVGGGYLFSSSFDKAIIVWSLQDFARVHTFRGHDHRVMVVTFVDGEQPMCISGDNGGGICIWGIGVPFEDEPFKKWSEPKDWRYSGIHALVVSGTGLLFTGSGDRLIKAWSLLDSSLVCSMEGHKSVVSSLYISVGVLFSGSWDGSVRLWSLHDYSPLATFGSDTPGPVSSVLSVYANQQTIIAAHENGFIKMWSNDVLQKSIQVHTGTIFALCVTEKWLFTGGWDKTIKVQEIQADGFGIEARLVGSIATDSVVTALLYTQGVLLVGCANKSIKVYHNSS